MALHENIQRTYASIIADGSIRVQADENDPKAVTREYETSSGVKGTKIERVYKHISGHIKYVAIYQNDFGRVLNITIAEEDEEGIILSLNPNASYAQDIMKKLPAIDFDQEVDFRPYSFDDKGKNKRGVTVLQDGKRVLNFFYDVEKKESTHNYPIPEKEYTDMDSDDWKVYFIGVTKFLRKYTEKHILPKFQTFDEEIKTYASPEEYVAAKKAEKEALPEDVYVKAKPVTVKPLKKTTAKQTTMDEAKKNTGEDHEQPPY